MADTRISGLTELAQGGIADADELVINDGDLTTKRYGYDSLNTDLAAKTKTLTNTTYDTGGSGNSLSIDGTALTANSGTGAMVRVTSATLVTPALGTPASGVATNLSGTAASLTAGNVTTNANLTGVVTSTGNATAIANKALAIAKLADGTDGELITWSSSAVIATVAVGTAAHVLTSNGTGAAPEFKVSGTGTLLGATTTNVDTHSTNSAQTIWSATIPAGALGTTDGYEVVIPIQNFDMEADGPRTVVFDLDYGTTTVATFTITGGGASDILNMGGTLTASIFAAAADDAQFAFISGAFGGAITSTTGSVSSGGAGDGTGSEDSTGALTLKVTVTHSTSEVTSGLVALGGYAKKLVA